MNEKPEVAKVFNTDSRTSNVVKTSTVSLFCSLLNLLLGFINRAVFIRLLSISYVGLDGLFSNILQLLSISELGLTTAVTYRLYKPIHDEDVGKVGSYMRFLTKAYNYIGISMLSLGAFLSIFLTHIVNAGDVPADVNLYVIYILFLVQSASAYFLSAPQILLTADQKQYKVSVFRVLLNAIKYILQIVALCIWRDYQRMLFIGIITNLILHFGFSAYCRRMYKEVYSTKESLSTEEISEIRTDLSAMMLHKVGGAILNGTDSIILSKFVGLVYSGIYSNYNIIITSLINILKQTIGMLGSSLGNAKVSLDENENYAIYKRLQYVNFFISGFTSLSLYFLINGFIEIWVGEKYRLDLLTVFVLCLQFYIQTCRLITTSYSDASGLYIKDRIRPLIEATLNVLISVVLVQKMGIAGVFLGTVISSLFTTVWREPYILYKYAFKRSAVRYYLVWIYMLLYTCINGVLFYRMFTYIEDISHIGEHKLIWWLAKGMLIAAVYFTLFFLTTFFSEPNRFYRRAAVRRLLRIKKSLKNLYRGEWNYKKVFMILPVISIVGRTAFAWFPKYLSTYMDELIYYHMADSFIRQGKMLVYNGSTVYEKRPLYSLCLIPAVLQESMACKTLMIAFINSLIMTSGMIPVYLLGRKMGFDKKMSLLMSGLYLLMPEMAFSMTFMTENLFIPVCLWTIYAYYGILHNLCCLRWKQGLSYVLLAGLMFIVGLKTKNTYIVLPLAFAGTMCLFAFFSVIRCIHNKSHIKLIILVAATAVAGVVAAIKAEPYLKTLGFDLNAYQGIAKRTIDSLITYYHENDEALELFVYNLTGLYMHFMVATGGITLILMIFYWDVYKRHDRYMLLFFLACLNISYVYIMKIVLAPVGDIVRTLFRYISYIYVPVIMLYLISLKEQAEHGKYKRDRSFFVISVLLMAAVSLQYKGAKWVGGSITDHMLLAFVTDRFRILWKYGGRFLWFLLMLAGLEVFRRNRKLFAEVFLSFFVLLQVVNNGIAIPFITLEYRHKDAYEEDVEALVKDNPEDIFLVIENVSDDYHDLGKFFDDTSRWSDMHLDYKNVYKETINHVLSLQTGEKPIDLENKSLRNIQGSEISLKERNLKYLMISKELPYDIDKSFYNEVHWDSKFYKIYELKDGSSIPVIKYQE